MSQRALDKGVVQSNVPIEAEEKWFEMLRQMALGGPSSNPTVALRAMAEAQDRRGTVAERISTLAAHPLDRLVLGALYLEGQDLDLRVRVRRGPGGEVIRKDWDDDILDERTTAMISAPALVAWLGGSDAGLRRQVAQRLLPQAGLAASRLIQRKNAATPLEGGVQLTPFLASLLYPGDGQEERRLDEALYLIRPKERLKDVVLRPSAREDLEAYLRLCRSTKGPCRAALFWGRAGTGKTLSARAVAGELGLPLLLVRTQAPESDTEIVERASAAARIEGAVLFFDECGRWMDSLSFRHGPSSESAMFLQVLQEHPGVIMAAINQSWLRLGEAFQRRFQYQVAYENQDQTERLELWKRFLERPSSPAILQRVAEHYPLTGGLIRNAASRLNSNQPGASLGQEELETAARSQLSTSLESFAAPPARRLAELRAGLSRSTRQKLAALGLRLKRAVDLPFAPGELDVGWKACLSGSIDLTIAAAYVGRLARTKIRLGRLKDLAAPKDDDRGFKRPAPDLRPQFEAVSILGEILCLRVQAGDLADDSPLKDLLDQYLEFNGRGLILAPEPRALGKSPHIGEWVDIRGGGDLDVEALSRRSFPGLDASGLTPVQRARLQDLSPTAARMILRWALTRQSQCRSFDAVAVQEALNAYDAQPGYEPLFGEGR